MRRFLYRFIEDLGISSERTKNIGKHIGWYFLYKIGSVVANFLLVPITIDYLNVENYGIWLTLSSFIAWFSFFDIGLGNGLRNKFAEAKSTGKLEKAQALVSTAYFTIGSISGVLAILFFVVNPFIEWSSVFNTDPNMESQLSLLLPIIFAFFVLQMIVNLITTIYQADQHHSIQGKFQFYSQAVALLAIWLLTKTDDSSLLIFGTLFSSLPVLILIGLNIFAFKGIFKEYRPKFSLWKKEHLKDITGLGFSFFVIQIAALILFSTDNFIITRLFSPEEVVPYNVAFKYFSIVTMVYTIIITPYWSSFTEAYSKNDLVWIQNSVKSIQKLWYLIPLGLIFMVFLADWFYYLWVGEKVKVPLDLSIAMACFILFFTFNMIYVSFINGVGKIRLQLITSVISMVINIPLSIYFGKYLGWGSTGVIWATSFCLLYTLPLWPMQYRKIINQKATGIWNK